MFAYYQDMPGATAETVTKVEAEIGPEIPQGLIGHVSGPSPKGWRMVDIWESEEDFERFAAERLGPAVQRATANLPQLAVPPTELKVTGVPDLCRRAAQSAPSI